MSPRRCARWVWLSLAVAAAGCQFDARVPPTANVRCDADGVCPGGFTCLRAVGRCVAESELDREAPTLVSSEVSPPRARRGTTLRLTLRMSEPLLQPPVAALVAGGLTPLTLQRADGLDFDFTLAVPDSAVEGPASLTVDATDLSGNTATGVPAGVVTLDFTPPVLRAASSTPTQAPDGGPARVRPVDPLSVRVTASEPLQPGATLRASSSCPALPALTARGSSGASVDFGTEAPGASGCAYALALEGAVDLAGNPAEAAWPLPLRYVVDGEPPTLTALQTFREGDAGLLAATRFSRVAPFDAVLLRFDVDDPDATLSVRRDDATLPDCTERRCLPSDAGLTCTCSSPVVAADLEGSHALTVTAKDRAGNARSASAPVVFDFTAPRVVAEATTLALAPPAGCGLQAVSALAVGAQAQLAVATDEPATLALEVSPGPLDVRATAVAETAVTFTLAVDAGATPAQGAHTLLVSTTDAVGNRATQSLPVTLDVDTVAPAPPLTDEDGGAVHERAPWGTADGGARFSVVAGPSAAAGGVLVRVLSDDGAPVELARAVVASDDSFACALPPPDRRAVRVASVDRACNESPPVPVRTVVWHGSLSGKRPDSGVENPHDLVAAEEFEPAWPQLRGRPADAAPLGSVGGGTLEVAGARSWRKQTVTALSGGVLVYDAARAETLLVGAQGRVGAVETWTWDGARWRLRSELGPGATLGYAATYDSARQRVVLVTRSASATSEETWEWDGVAWALVATSGPAPRTFAAVAYDSARLRTVLFGGQGDVGVLFDDTWAWDGVAWQQLADAGPSPRTAHAMVDDPVRRRVVLFGGQSATVPSLRDTWELDDAGWTRLTTTGPANNGDPALYFDAARQRVTFFGSGGLWEWSGAAWTQRTTTGPPAYAAERALAYDSARQRLVAYGGYSYTTYRNLAETYELDGTTWARRSLPITGLVTPALTYDSANGRLVFHGGSNGVSPVGGTYAFTDGGWQLVSSSGPALADAKAVFDPSRGKVVLHGGTRLVAGNNERSVETWEWPVDGGAWERRATVGPHPDGSVAYDNTFGLAHDLLRRKTTFFTSRTQSSLWGDAYVTTWDWDGTSWTERSDSGVAPSFDYALGYDVGAGQLVAISDGRTYGWDGGGWLERAIPRLPGSFAPFGIAYDGDRGRVVTGDSYYGQWSFDGQRWGKDDVLGVPTPTSSPLVFDEGRHRMVLLGGWDNNSGAELDWSEYGLHPEVRPGLVASFDIGAAGAEVGSALRSVSVAWRGGGSGELAAATAPGARLWVHDGRRFVDLGGVAASRGQPAWVEWSSADAAAIARLLGVGRPTLRTALTTTGFNAPVTPAQVEADYVEVVLRYRRP